MKDSISASFSVASSIPACSFKIRLAAVSLRTSLLSRRLWSHPPEPNLVSGRFSRLVERCLKACPILVESLCRVAWSISRSNGSRPSFSPSQESRQEPCRAPQSRRAACSCLHGVCVWHSEESARPSHLQGFETLLQQNPLAAWLSREEDVLAETGPVGTSTALD